MFFNTRDRAWAESEKMGAFLAVAQGSQEPLRFLEIDYKGGPPSQPPLALVGKGITFDTWVDDHAEWPMFGMYSGTYIFFLQVLHFCCLFIAVRVFVFVLLFKFSFALVVSHFSSLVFILFTKNYKCVSWICCYYCFFFSFFLSSFFLSFFLHLLF